MGIHPGAALLQAKWLRSADNPLLFVNTNCSVAGNNWAFGYVGEGASAWEAVEDMVQREVCDVEFSILYHPSYIFLMCFGGASCRCFLSFLLL